MTLPANERTAEHAAFLSLGSNIDPEGNLPAAVRELQDCGRIVAVSRVWETPPFGYADQPNFLNAAVKLATRLAIGDLRAATAAIERKLQRVRDPANVNGPRTIDVDVVLFDSETTTAPIPLPAPEILQHAFVAVPLAETDPGWIHPGTGRSLSEIAARFGDAMQTMRVRDDVVLVSGESV